MNKETINEINNKLILLVEGFEDAERDYNYDLANEKHYVSEIIALVKKLTLTDVSQQRELLIRALEEYDQVKYEWSKLTYEDYVDKYHPNL